MAREQRKDVDYFPHDCTHGRKMHIIETKYGNDGYATWFKLLEQLGKANNHYIDISDEMTLMFLISTFKIDENRTLSILNDLAKLGAIDKFLYEEHKIIFSQKFTESIQDAYRKRKLKCFQYSDVLNEIMQKNAQSGGSLTHTDVNRTEVIPKEKKSRVKERKEENSKGETKSHSGAKTPVENTTKFWVEFVAMWFEFYKSKFDADPTFNGANGKSLKSIVTRIEKLSKNKNIEWTEETAKKSFTKFLANAWEDNWMKENFLLNNLSSKFDAIINKTPIQQNGGKRIFKNR